MKKSLLLTLVSLLVFNAVAWGEDSHVCTESDQYVHDIKRDKTSDHWFKFGFRCNTLTFDAKRTKKTASGTITVLEYNNSNVLIASTDYSDIEGKTQSISHSLNPNTRQIAFKNNSTNATSKEHTISVSNAVVTSPEESIMIHDVDCGSYTSGGTRTANLTIDYSATTNALMVEQLPSNNYFSIDCKKGEEIVATDNCNTDTKNLTVTFSASAIGEYKDIVTFKYGTQIITVPIIGYIKPTILAPTEFSVSDASYTSVTGTWTKVDGAQGYRIVNNLNGQYQNVEGGETTSATITGLMPDNTYSFTIYPTVNGAPSTNGRASGNIKTTATDCGAQELSDITLGDAVWGGFKYSEKTSDKTATKHQPIVSFDYEVSNNACTGVNFRIYEKVGGSWIQKWSSSSYKGSNVVALSRGVTEIRFAYKGNFAGYFKNIKIFQTAYVEVSSNTLNFGLMEVGDTKELTVTSQWSSLPVNVGSDNTEFKASPESFGSSYCENESQTIKIKYTAGDIGTQSGIVTIGDNKVKVSATCVLPKPKTLTANPTYRSVDLSWSQVNGADGYYLANTTTGEHVELDGISNTTYTWTGLDMNKDYIFTVQARKGTLYSEAKEVSTKTATLEVPTLTATDIKYNDATLNWNEIEDAGSYRIICEALSMDAIIGKGYKTLALTGLSMHTKYTFKIISRLSDGTESPLGYNSVIFDTNDLAAPQNFTTEEVSYTSIPTVWDAVEDATGYRIQNETLGTYEDIDNKTNAYLFAALNANTEYTISVTPIYNGELSNNKASLTVTTKETPYIPVSDCEQFRDVSEKSMEAFLIGKSTNYNFGKAIYKSNVSFKAKASNGALLNTDLYAQVNGQWQKIWDESDAKITSSYKTFTATVPDGATAIRFYNNTGSSMWRNYSEVIVKRRNELTPSTTLLQFGDVLLGSTDTKTITVDYSNLSDMTVLSEGSNVFKVEIPETKACDYGTIECKVSYSPVTLDKTQQGTLTIFNGITKGIAIEGGVTPLPAANATAAATGKSAISVQWDKVAGATGYKLTCADAGINVTLPDDGSEHYSYNATGLDENTKYTFIITTMYNALENESASASATTYSTVKVEKAGAFAETTTFTLSGVEGQWNKDENSFASGSTATINASNSNVCAKFDKLTIGETEYTTLPQAFIVNAPATATIYYTAKELDAPVVTVNCGSKNSAELSWSAVECADSYTVYVNGVEAETGITATSYTATDLTPATDYTFVVKAVSGSLETASESATATTYGVIKVQVGGDATSTTDWTLTGEAGKWNETEESFEVGSNVSVLAINSDAGVIFDKIQYYGGESTVNPTSITVLNASVAETWAGIYYKYNGVAKTDDGQVFPTLNDAVEYSKTHEVSEVTLLTDRPTENLDLTSGSKLILNGNGFKIGDVTVESGAKLTTSGALIMGNLNIKTEYRNSGEVDPNGQNLDVMGTVSFDKILDPSGKVNNSMWYAVCVPFPVDIKDIYGIGPNGEEISLGYGVNVLFDKYDGAKRASTGKGWVHMSANETLKPGDMHILLSDYNTLRFYKKDDAAIVSDLTSIQLQEFGSTAVTNQGWNAIGNSQIFHIEVSSETEFGQTLVHGTKEYDVVDLSSENFAVASPVFIQYKEGSKSVNFIKQTSSSLRSVEMLDDLFNIRLSDNTGYNFADQMFIRASETSSADYIIGKDLAKMGDLTGTSIARIWMKAKNTNLCVIDAKLVDGSTEIPIGLYAPKAGNYDISLGRYAYGLNLELLYNGEIIHNFADGSFSTALTKGSNNGYSLKVSVDSENPITTDVVEVNGISAYITEGTLYISGLNDGDEFTVYNLQNKVATGKANGGVEKVALPIQGVYMLVSGDSTIKLLNK